MKTQVVHKFQQLNPHWQLIASRTRKNKVLVRAPELATFPRTIFIKTSTQWSSKSICGLHTMSTWASGRKIVNSWAKVAYLLQVIVLCEKLLAEKDQLPTKPFASCFLKTGFVSVALMATKQDFYSTNLKERKSGSTLQTPFCKKCLQYQTCK